MTQEEKLDKVCKDFCLLGEDKKDYILGILQVLIFAHESKATEQRKKPLNNDGTCTAH